MFDTKKNPVDVTETKKGRKNVDKTGKYPTTRKEKNKQALSHSSDHRKDKQHFNPSHTFSPMSVHLSLHFMLRNCV